MRFSKDTISGSQCEHYKHCTSCADKVQPNDNWIGARISLNMSYKNEVINLRLPKPLVDFLDLHDMIVRQVKGLKLKAPSGNKKKEDPKKTPNNHETIVKFFDALENPYKSLTKWETEFLESIKDQFENRGTLSDKQFEILERIYSEKTN